MESPLSFFRVHWGHEPLAVPRWTESADKSDALQTLCAVRRRPAVAKRLECVRLQRRFPKAGYDSMTGQVYGKPPFVFSACIGTMNRWPSRAGRKARINRTHSKRFALPAESTDDAAAFGARASSAPLSQGRLQFDGRACSRR